MTLSTPAQTSPNRPQNPVPPGWLAAAELPRAVLALASMPLQLTKLLASPRGNGQPVMVIPGFGVTDASTIVLRTYLARLGYDVTGWQLGRNLGAKTVGVHNEHLLRRLSELFQVKQQPIALIGWSMGGIMARMIARKYPGKVKNIICLGAPITGDPFANRAWRVYERMSGHSLSHPIARAQIAESKLPPPVPSVSIYSKSDGVVAWQSCLEPIHHLTSNIEVNCPHVGFGFDANVFSIIADNLAERQGVQLS